MNKKYDIEFSAEIERILNEIYYNPFKSGDNYKRAVIFTEPKYIQFLIEHDIVERFPNYKYEGEMLELRKNGYEVFEKYNGWKNYRKKVILKNSKYQEAKILAQRYWWLPIVISTIALLVAIISYINY